MKIALISDYMLVLPWHFKEFILKNNSWEMVSNKINKAKVDLSYLPMRPGEKLSNDIDRESIDLILEFSKLNLQDDEYQIVANKIRELGRNVVSNASSLKQIGVSNQDFVTFDVGISQTIDWYIKNEGVTWSKA